jgi:Acetyltransferase (GNAT) domain
MGWDVEVRTLAEAAFPAWEKFVATAPSGSVYSLPTYLDALCTAGGGRFRVVGVMRGEEIVGGVALYERPSRGGPFVSPRLLLYYNGVVVRKYDTQYPSEATARHVKILTALESGLAGMGLGSIHLHSRAVHDVRPFTSQGWSATPGYSYVVALDMETAWGRVEQNLRRLIDRARNAGMTANADDDDFDAFFRLHAATLDRHGAGVYLPQPAFRRFYDALKRNRLGRLFQVRTKDGTPAAAQLTLLGPHPITHTACAGADAESNKLGASAFLRWSAFETLAALGYRGNDLTDAALNPVTHFKSQLGGSLELSMVLRSPSTPRFRWNLMAESAVRRARGRAGAVVRRLASRNGREA